MKLARFAYNGKIHEAEYRDEQLWVGSVAYDPNDVMWLPPTETRGITVYGVALGYADHAEELGLEKGGLSMGFMHFQKFEGELKLPVGFIPKELRVQVKPKGKQFKAFEDTFKWQVG